MLFGMVLIMIFLYEPVFYFTITHQPKNSIRILSLGDKNYT